MIRTISTLCWSFWESPVVKTYQLLWNIERAFRKSFFEPYRNCRIVHFLRIDGHEQLPHNTYKWSEDACEALEAKQFASNFTSRIMFQLSWSQCEITKLQCRDVWVVTCDNQPSEWLFEVTIHVSCSCKHLYNLWRYGCSAEAWSASSLEHIAFTVLQLAYDGWFGPQRWWWRSTNFKMLPYVAT